MNKEDIDFLKQLQKEMLTQDNCEQASPRFWSIMTIKRIYWVDDDVTGYEIFIDEESAGESIKDVLSYIKEYHEDYCEEFPDKIIEFEKYKRLSKLTEVLKDEGFDILRVPYRDIYVVAKNTLFLTLEECKKHIERNGYHYKNPQPYCMTAWRSPQVERLFSILEHTDWSLYEGTD